MLRLIDQTKVYEVSDAELELAFRRMKEILDEKNMDYRVLIFDIETDAENENELDRDPEQIKLSVSKETLEAIPLMKEEFIDKIFDSVIPDRDFAERLALGCQQIARSVCFVHYWAFNSLWLTYNSTKNLG